MVFLAARTLAIGLGATACIFFGFIVILTIVIVKTKTRQVNVLEKRTSNDCSIDLTDVAENETSTSPHSKPKVMMNL